MFNMIEEVCDMGQKSNKQLYVRWQLCDLIHAVTAAVCSGNL